MDSFDHFLDQIGRYPLLTTEEEITLARQVQAWLAIRDKSRLGSRQKRICVAGKRAYDRMFLSNLRLVVHGAKKFIRVAKHLTIDDLVQEGCFGLSRSIEKFDPERGYKFSTYSYWWIRQSMMRALEINDRTIRLPVTAVQTLIKLRKWATVFEMEHGRLPTQQECIDHADVSAEYFESYMMHAAGCGSLDVKATADSSSNPILDLISDDRADVLVEIEESDELKRLRQAIKTLNQEETELLDARYGIGGGTPKSRREIGRTKYVSREAIRLREVAILDKLRQEADSIRSF